MKVKMIKNQKVNQVVELQKGTIFEVRLFSELPFQFNAPFQIIEGDHSGIIIPRECCIEVQDETKTLTEIDWKAREDYYLARLNKEKEEKERAQQLSRELTNQIMLKSQEINKLNFFLNTLRQTLIFFAFNNNKEMEYEKQNG